MERQNPLSLEEMLKLAKNVQDWTPTSDEGWQSYKGNSGEVQVLVTEFKGALSGFWDHSYRIGVNYQGAPLGRVAKRWSSKRNKICQLYTSIEESERNQKAEEKNKAELEQGRLAQEGLLKIRSS